jgi:hypothetical protein
MECEHEIGTWDVRSLYRADSLTSAQKELSKYKLDLVGVHKVRWEVVALNQQENTYSSMEKEMKTMNFGEGNT